MTEKDQKILCKFSTRVRELFPKARIWAFGSRARETAHANSDLDVCVVVDNLTEQNDDKIIKIAWEVGLDHGLVITPVAYSSEEFNNGPCSLSPLVRVIRSEGIAA